MAGATPAGGPAGGPVGGLWAGRAALVLGLVGALVATVLLARVSPLYGLAAPAAVLGAAVLGGLSRVPLGHLCGVLFLFGVTARLKAGLQVEELVYAGYYLSYLGGWFGTRVWVYRERVVETKLDLAVMAFLVWMTASLALTVVFRGDPGLARGDWIAFSTFAFYFPIKEACVRYRWGPWLVVGVVLYLGLFSFVRNLILFATAIQDAEYAWQIARGRVPMNEMLLFVPALGCLGFAVRAERWRDRLVLMAGFGLFTVGVILTQWRAYYVDLAFGVLLFGVFLGWRGRAWLALLVGAGGVLGLGLGTVVFGDTIQLVVVGIVDRILSIGTASTSDISLLNRFLESRSAWALIEQNPVVGYGLGTTFSFYDTIYNATWTKSFVHNGFLMLWFKLGIVGLGLVVFAWAASIVAAYGVWWRRGPDEWERTIGLSVAVTLVALIPSHFVSAAFTTSDTVMAFALLMGTAAGLSARAASPGPAATDGTAPAGGRA